MRVASSGTTLTDAGGSVTVEPDGAFSYLPVPGFSGRDRFDVVLGGFPEGSVVVAVILEVSGDPEAEIDSPVAVGDMPPPPMAILHDVALADAVEAGDPISIVVAPLPDSDREAPDYLACEYFDGTTWIPFSSGEQVSAPAGQLVSVRYIAFSASGQVMSRDQVACQVDVIVAEKPAAATLDSAEPETPAPVSEEEPDGVPAAISADAGAPDDLVDRWFETEVAVAPLPEAYEARLTLSLLSPDGHPLDVVRGDALVYDGSDWRPVTEGDVVGIPPFALSVKLRLAKSVATESGIVAEPDRLRALLQPIEDQIPPAEDDVGEVEAVDEEIGVPETDPAPGPDAAEPEVELDHFLLDDERDWLVDADVG